jgi:hypothetical protein
MEEAAFGLGCYPWDVAGVFAMKHAQQMTRTDFESALKEWRTPPPRPTRKGA